LAAWHIYIRIYGMIEEDAKWICSNMWCSSYNL